MPNLPPLPELTEAQYAHLVGVFTERGAANGVDPASEYVRWSLDNLIQLVRTHATEKLNAELGALGSARQAELDEMLADLITPQAPEPG